MNKTAIKKLIKFILKEIYAQKHRGPSTDTYNDYNVYFESLLIPGLSTEDDEVEVTLSISFEGERGESPKGMFGPPENSSPGYGTSVSIIEWWPTLITIHPRGGIEKELDPNSLTPEQQQILDGALSEYMKTHEDAVEQTILDNSGGD